MSRSNRNFIDFQSIPDTENVFIMKSRTRLFIYSINNPDKNLPHF
jgi:hypothetical protein